MKQSYIFPMKSYRNAAAVCFMALSSATLAQAQVPGSALDYMLQRPRVTKQYTDKHAFDHLFLDAGAGGNFIGSKSGKVGPQAELGIGDWITPEHGMRLNFSGGAYNTSGVKAKYGNVALDYLLNITALSQRGSTYTSRPFEVYGVAGIDFAVSKAKGVTESGFGGHIGLRGQAAISPYTYFYIEPRAGLMQDDVSQAYTWHGYRPVASVTAGFGYRFAEDGNHGKKGASESYKGANGLFVGLAGGPLFFANAHPDSWTENTGGRVAFNVGKWFTPLSALRLGVSATTLKQSGANRANVLGGQLDYLLNLHNAFGGVNNKRWFWINGVAGVSLNATADGTGKHYSTFGLGGGLQGNFRLAPGFAFTLEPRIDMYQENYAPALSSVSKWDATASILAGLTYTYNESYFSERAHDDFTQQSWHDHMFVEMGVGGNLPVIKKAASHPFQYVRPQVTAAVGKWFTPLHGARIWAQFAQTEYNHEAAIRTKHFDFGADYLFNFTNALYGYRAERPFELSGSLGAGLSHRQQVDKLFFGMDASLRGTFNVNPFFGIYIEPRLQGYGKNYLPTALGSTKVDFIASASAGVQFKMNGYNRTDAMQRAEEDGNGLRSSVYVLGGLAAPAKHLRSSDYYMPVGRIGYTQWFTPLSAWRLSLGAQMQRKVEGQRYAQVGAAIDYMTDLTAQTYGYDPYRAVSINALAGFGFGMDRGAGKTYFAPDFHVGGQMAVRLGNYAHLLFEPQISARLSKRFKDSQLNRWAPQMMIGLDYSLERQRGARDPYGKPQQERFVSVSIGTGGYTGNFTQMDPFRRKFTFASDVAYGQWVNALSGFRAGASNTVVQRHGKGNENITSVHIDYMMDLCTAIGGEGVQTGRFRLTGLAGAMLGFSSREGRDTKVAPGLEAAIQAGVRVTPNVEVYLEPSATIFTKGIEPGTSHPAEGELKLSLGTKFYF